MVEAHQLITRLRCRYSVGPTPRESQTRTHQLVHCFRCRLSPVGPTPRGSQTRKVLNFAYSKWLSRICIKISRQLPQRMRFLKKLRRSKSFNQSLRTQSLRRWSSVMRACLGVNNSKFMSDVLVSYLPDNILFFIMSVQFRNLTTTSGIIDTFVWRHFVFINFRSSNLFRRTGSVTSTND